MTTELTEYDKYNIMVQPWYVNLVDELKDLITEVEFTSRWALVEGYHSLGSRILLDYANFQRLRMPDNELIATVATSLHKSSRTIYYAIQFAREYPDLNLLPEGKDTNWHKIVNKYLTTGEKKVVKKSDLYRMIKEIKGLLEKEWLKLQQERITAERIISGELEAKGEFIRYLQDQVNKITGELGG